MIAVPSPFPVLDIFCSLFHVLLSNYFWFSFPALHIVFCSQPGLPFWLPYWLCLYVIMHAAGVSNCVSCSLRFARFVYLGIFLLRTQWHYCLLCFMLPPIHYLRFIVCSATSTCHLCVLIMPHNHCYRHSHVVHLKAPHFDKLCSFTSKYLMPYGIPWIISLAHSLFVGCGYCVHSSCRAYFHVSVRYQIVPSLSLSTHSICFSWFSSSPCIYVRILSFPLALIVSLAHISIPCCCSLSLLLTTTCNALALVLVEIFFLPTLCSILDASLVAYPVPGRLLHLGIWGLCSGRDDVILSPALARPILCFSSPVGSEMEETLTAFHSHTPFSVLW